jgi:hypothetical protein
VKEKRLVQRLSPKELYQVTDHLKRWWDQFKDAKLTAGQIAERCAQDLKIEKVTPSHIRGIVTNILGLDFDHVPGGGVGVRLRNSMIRELLQKVGAHEEALVKLRSEVGRLTTLIEEHVTAPTLHQGGQKYRMENGRVVPAR